MEIAHHILELQRRNRWGLGMDRKYHHTLNLACDHMSTQVLKLIRVSKMGP